MMRIPKAKDEHVTAVADKIVASFFLGYARADKELADALRRVAIERTPIARVAKETGIARSTLRRHAPLCLSFARRVMRLAGTMLPPEEQ